MPGSRGSIGARIDGFDRGQTSHDLFWTVPKTMIVHLNHHAVVGAQQVLRLEDRYTVRALILPISAAGKDDAPHRWTREGAAGDGNDPPGALRGVADDERSGQRGTRLEGELEIGFHCRTLGA